eukprot:3116487-Amphidinium_carterae.1
MLEGESAWCTSGGEEVTYGQCLGPMGTGGERLQILGEYRLQAELCRYALRDAGRESGLIISRIAREAISHNQSCDLSKLPP